MEPEGLILHSFTTALEKYAIFVFYFLENLVDFNVARLLEATFNLHTHASIFPLCQ